ncbi:hypothetical protein GGH17_001627 [Coemansia sp. RSA 788]|nr:hypothetical protein LPJ54_004529 [Coemansia sp. RSA 1824]KAJ2137285.1 hypothetical protein GGH17_001627 [Coemansia sp. RSA 788]KAJ2153301.1 hypothetical protein J3F82_002068 [Coemansia sp. RSA 637]KAJ2168264.1 hypothetical protein GGH15_001518 [Coemansia sp. RSA 562]KAJ2191518.1 hypothetical protein EV181_000191 [Coemansia sp. RSA 532]KAJ2230053.1 hypothetical protein GGH97_006244 [Coemansia sp. RSA 475]
MTNVLISGVYPQREGETERKVTVTPSACPLHAPVSSDPPLKYAPTHEDESMREALKLLHPICDDFRTADYATSFNWPKITESFIEHLKYPSELPARSDYEWYAVVFRSQRRADCRDADLFEADRQAYEEAFSATNGALLVYWYTGLDENHNCLATCVWSARDIARSVNSLPRHREAAKLSAHVYVSYHIDRYRISWVPSQQSLSVVPW